MRGLRPQGQCFKQGKIKESEKGAEHFGKSGRDKAVSGDNGKGDGAYLKVLQVKNERVSGRRLHF